MNEYQLFRKLILQITKEKNNDSELVWIVDGVAHQFVINFLKHNVITSDFCPLYLDTYNDELRNSGPWFINYYYNDSFSNWIIDNLAFYPLGMLLEIKKDDYDLAFEYYQNLLNCELPTEQKILFRFYDPRILYAILNSNNYQVMDLIQGPSCHLYSWEPGHVKLIQRQQINKEYKNFNKPLILSEAFIDYIWYFVRNHTIINNLSGLSGLSLQNKPLSEAFSYVELIKEKINLLGFDDIKDLSFAVAYSLRSNDLKIFDDLLKNIELFRQVNITSLEEALTSLTINR